MSILHFWTRTHMMREWFDKNPFRIFLQKALTSSNDGLYVVKEDSFTRSCFTTRSFVSSCVKKRSSTCERAHTWCSCAHTKIHLRGPRITVCASFDKIRKILPYDEIFCNILLDAEIWDLLCHLASKWNLDMRSRAHMMRELAWVFTPKSFHGMRWSRLRFSSGISSRW